MRLAYLVLVMPVFAVLLAGSVADVSAAGMNKGVLEIRIQNALNFVSYSFEDEDYGNTTDWGLTFGVGKCATDMVEVGGGVDFRYRRVSPEGFGAVSATAIGPRGFVIFNFATQGQIVPYLEAGIGLRFFTGDGYDDSEVSVAVPTVGGGFRVLVGNSASVNIGLTYQHVTNEEGEGNLTGNEFLLGVGVSLLL